jgi:hypothetical protein
LRLSNNDWCNDWLRLNSNWLRLSNNDWCNDWLRSLNDFSDFDCALLLASREDIASASCSNIGSNITASCICESLAVCAISVLWNAKSCAFHSSLFSAVKVGHRVRSAPVEGLSIAVASVRNIVWFKSLCSCNALCGNNCSAPSSNEGCNRCASCN